MLTSILCPIDFSADAERALRYALELASLTGARVTLLTVTDALLDAAARAAGSGGTMVDQTQRELGALLERVAPPTGKPVVAVAVAVGVPADEILKHAADAGADLIVMGTQGMGAAERFFLGSTTERVLREATIPVLAVPPRQRS